MEYLRNEIERLHFRCKPIEMQKYNEFMQENHIEIDMQPQSTVETSNEEKEINHG